jgi:hypothetical protein
VRARCQKTPAANPSSAIAPACSSRRPDRSARRPSSTPRIGRQLTTAVRSAAGSRSRLARGLAFRSAQATGGGAGAGAGRAARVATVAASGGWGGSSSSPDSSVWMVASTSTDTPRVISSRPGVRRLKSATISSAV